MRDTAGSPESEYEQNENPRQRTNRFPCRGFCISVLRISVAVCRQNSLVSHVAVELRNDFKRGVHAQHRHAGIDGVDVAVCHVLGNGAAAALVDLSHLGSADASLVEDLPLAPVYLQIAMP